MDKHYPPDFQQRQFHCPHCNVFARQDFYRLPTQIHTTAGSDIVRSECSHCDKNCYWHDSAVVHGRIIIPASYGTPPANEYMPDDVIADYMEAASIFSLSARGAAALLRLSLQKLMVHLGMEGKNINEDIKKLVAAGLPVMIQQALDYCRVVGNNAVHPGELSLEDTPEMAWTMFEMINMIVQLRIAAPKQLEELYAQLPEGARTAIAKRDSKPQERTPPAAP